MEINIHAKTMMEGFKKTGTLGMPGTERTEFKGMQAALMLGTRVQDYGDVVKLDDSPGDTDRRTGFINLSPTEAIKHVPDGFGAVTSFQAEFEGPAEDPGDMTAAIDGPDSSKIMHVSSSGNEVTLFEARSKDDKGFVIAGKFTVDGLNTQGYMESLDIPWHMAR